MRRPGRRATRALRGTGLAIAAAAIFAAGPSRAAYDDQDFVVKNAEDLVDLCSVTSGQANYAEASFFCRGFVSGAWQYHQALANGPKGERIVCPPEPPPTRDQAIAMFVGWAGTHKDVLTQPAVEVLFEFLAEKYPCASAAPAKAPGKKGGSK